MKKNLCIFLYYIFFYIQGYAQNVYKGSVVNEQKHPLENVSVSDERSKALVITDSNGFFKLKSAAPIGQLHFVLYGYKSVWVPADSIHEMVVVMLKELTELNDFVVSAGRHEQKLGEVTVSLEVLKPRVIEQTNAVKLDAVMDQVPGVNIINGQANIRGGSGFSYGAGSRVLLLVDDLPMLSADAGDIKWDAIPLENIKQVEVIKGASSALFGAGALGGVINLRTAPVGNKPVLKVQVFSGVYDTPLQPKYKFYKGQHYSSGSSGLYSRKFGRLDFTVGYYYLNDQGYRKDEVYKNMRANLGLRYHFKKAKGLDIGVNGSIFNSKFGNFLFWKNLDSVYWPADGTIAHMHTKRYTVDPYIIHQPSKNFKQSLRGRLFVTDNKNDKQQSSLAYLLFGEYQAQLTKEWGNNIKLTTSAGGSHTNTSIKSEGFYGFHQGSNSAIFAQFDAKLYKTNISVGLREEYNRIDSIRAQGFPVIRAGFSQQFFKATYLRGSYGTGYRFPSVAERFTTTNAGGIVVAPNPSLLTETGKSSEIGLKQGLKFGKWTGYADAALFWTRYNYLIDFVFDNNLFAFQSKNLGNAKISGTEFTLAGTGKIGKVQTWLTSGYTFINPRYADTLIQPTLWDSIPYNNYLKYRFRHTWKVNIDAEYKNINIGATLRYNSYMLNMDPTLYFIVPGTYEYRTTHAHGYYILDLRASYIYKKNHRLSFIVKNSLNTEYLIVVGNMGAPRSFVLQYNLTL